jgi:chromosome segregation ATPase
MKQSLDRRLEQFQAKVQQKITLADDEIVRSEEYLDQLRSKIGEVEDQIHRVELQVQQRADEKGGSQKRRVAANHAEAASMKRDHHAVLTEYLARFQEEDDALRAGFDAQFSEMERYVQARAAERSEPIQEKMSKITTMIGQLREKVDEETKKVDPTAQLEIEATLQIECDRIASLEKQAKDRNADRLNSLVQGRTQLAQCVRTLEEMEQKYYGDMTNLKQKLDLQDRKYQERLKSLSENHNRQKETLSRKIDEAETRTGQARKSLKRMERHFKREMGGVGSENEQIQAEFANMTTAEMKRMREEGEIVEAENQMTQLRGELEKREGLLLKIRSQTQMMRRELARIKHERVLAKRRAALDLV